MIAIARNADVIEINAITIGTIAATTVPKTRIRIRNAIGNTYCSDLRSSSAARLKASFALANPPLTMLNSVPSVAAWNTSSRITSLSGLSSSTPSTIVGTSVILRSAETRLSASGLPLSRSSK